MKYGEEAQRLNHDMLQAHRRTTIQNEKLIEIINSIKPVEGQMWSFSDVPPEGGPVEITNIQRRKLWTIERDGTVTSSDV